MNSKSMEGDININTVENVELLEKEYDCTLCGKNFSVSSNLKRHIRRVHENKNDTNAVKKSISCSMCDYKCRDNYQLKVHTRSHTKEKPFNCSKCDFKSSKKEDCKRHMNSCKGPKYKCSNCQAIFKSRSSVNEHHVWDSVCGTLASKESDETQIIKKENDRSIVKIIISKEMSVVGVNCNELLDKEVFEKRRRKTRCGLCFNCTSVESCGKCKVCVNLSQNSSNQICLKRSCNNPIELYELKKSNCSTFLNAEEIGQDNVTNVVDDYLPDENNDEIIYNKDDLLIDGPVDMFDNIEVNPDENTELSGAQGCILMHEDVIQL